MRAIRWHARKDVRFEEVEDAPAPRPHEVCVRVEWCGICGTDLEEWEHGPLLIPVGEPNRLTGIKAPLTLGHEVSGTVVDAGREVGHLREGDRVCLDALIHCNECWWCERHEVTLCPDLGVVGLSAHGGLAERVTVPAGMCVPLPDQVGSDTGALAEPLAVAVRAMRKARLNVGDCVAVLGGGTIGLATAAVARAMGAGSVALGEPLAGRRQLAENLGVDCVFDPLEEDGLAELEKLAGERGPDIVVDCAGTPASGPMSVSMARAGGKAVIVGLCGRTSAISFADIAVGEKQIIGSLSHVWDEDFRVAVRFLELGLFRAKDVVGARIPLEDTVTRGFELLGAGTDKAKVLVSPNL